MSSKEFYEGSYGCNAYKINSFTKLLIQLD